MFTLGSGTCSAQAWYSGGMVQPPATAVLSQAASGGALSNGTFYVTVTSINLAGESTPFAEQSIVVNGGGAANKIIVTVTAPATGPAPTGYNVYISPTSGYTSFQGTTAGLVYNQTGALTTNGMQARFVGLITVGEVGGDVEFDLSWQSKDFYGQSNFPIARAFYGGKGTVKAKKVEINPLNLDNLIAGTSWAQTGTAGSGTDVYTYTNTTLPTFLYVKFVHTRSDTANKSITVELIKASTQAFMIPFMREDISTHDWEFNVLADSTVSNQTVKVSVTQ